MKKFLNRILRGLLTSPEKRAEDAFLAEATDLADLEWRIKEINRGRLYNTFKGGQYGYF